MRTLLLAGGAELATAPAAEPGDHRRQQRQRQQRQQNKFGF